MNCPNCRRPLVEAPELAGQSVACPHCEYTFVWPGSDGAQQPFLREVDKVSHGYSQKRKTVSNHQTVIIVSVVGALLFIVFLVSLTVQEPARRRDLQREAIGEARQFVGRYLGYGETAHFTNTVSQQAGTRCYTISGNVAPQRGSRKKTRFECTLSFWTAASEWKCVKLRVGNKVLVDEPRNRARYAKLQ